MIELKILFNSIFALGAYPVLDDSFSARVTEPLMPVNHLWRQELTDHVHEVGMLLEVHVVACRADMLSFAKIWWPLTNAVMSRHLNVSSSDVCLYKSC